MGFWSWSWGEIQVTYLHNLRKFMNIDSWRGKVQLEVWNYAQSLLDYNNKLLHGDSNCAKLEIERASIMTQVISKLESMLVGSSRIHLKDKTILEKSVSYQKRWLRIDKAEERKFVAKMFMVLRSKNMDAGELADQQL